MAERKFSELNTATVLTDSDIFALSQEDNQTLMSKKTTLLAIANKIATLTNFTNALNTTDKTLAGAINEIKTLAELIPQFNIVVVETLPVSDISETTIYLVPSSNPETQNAYDEFIYSNNAWEQVGSTSVDLSSYYTKTETDNLLNDKADLSDLSDYYTKTESNALLNNKLDIDGTSEKTKSVVVATPYNDNDPYIYRQTPVKESFKTLMHKVVGASVVWNQLGFAVGRAETNQYYPMFRANSSGFKVNIINGHKYLISFIQPSGCAVYRQDRTGLTIGYKTYSSPTTNTKIMFVASCTETRSEEEVSSMVSKSSTTEESYNLTNCMFVDLTAMFGSTIADYVYTLETSQSGSGIAWLQSYGFFTEDYYAYKQNKLESGCVSAKKIYGKNLVFETLSSTNITASGEIAENATNLYDLQIAEVKKGITYTASSGLYAFYVNRPQIGSVSYDGSRTVGSNKTFVAPITGYVAFRTDHNYATPQLEVGSAETSYVPYVEPTTYPISPITLRGLFNLSTDKLTVDGDEYNADGSVTRKYGIVEITNNTSLTGFQTSADYGAYANISGISAKVQGTDIVRLIADKCEVVSFNNRIASPTIDRAYIDNNGNLVIRANNSSSISSADALKSEFLGTTIIYEVATPTTEQTTLFTETEIVGSTEEFIDYEVAQSNRDVAIPVGTDTDYYQEMKLPSLPTADGSYVLTFNPSAGYSWQTFSSNNRALLRIEPNTIEEVYEPLEESSESEER